MGPETRSSSVVVRNAKGFAGGGTRREFIGRQMGLLIKLSLLSAILFPLLRFLRYRIQTRPRQIRVNKSLKAGGFIIESEFIIFDQGGRPLAVSRKCTHLGCRLNYNELEEQLICPCHQSRFTREGRRIAGPAVLDLPVYKVAKLEGGERQGFIVSI